MAFECLPDCGKCCGVVAFAPAHFERVKARATVDYKADVVRLHHNGAVVVLPAGADGRCAFLDRSTKRCAVHDDKPDLCRRFGLSEDPLLACPFVDPTGRKRSRQGQRRAFRNTANKMLRLLVVEGAS